MQMVKKDYSLRILPALSAGVFQAQEEKMITQQAYFNLARGEEKAGNAPAALLFYLSSFAAAYNASAGHPIGTVAKIRSLQGILGLGDSQLCQMVRSYGPLSDEECQHLLYFALYGHVGGINAILGYA